MKWCYKMPVSCAHKPFVYNFVSSVLSIAWDSENAGVDVCAKQDIGVEIPFAEQLLLLPN